jgi:hypothetical protein
MVTFGFKQKIIQGILTEGEGFSTIHLPIGLACSVKKQIMFTNSKAVS